MTEWLLIAVVVLLSGFFSGSEIAFVSANRLKLELRARKNTMSARFLSFFVRNPDSFMSTTLIGNNIVNVAYATLMTLFLTDNLVSTYESLFGVPPTEAMVLIMQTTIASLIIMVFGEVLPKAMFRTYPDVFIAFLSGPLRVLSWLFYPFVLFTNSIARFLINLIQKEPAQVEEFFRRSDIELLFREIGTESNGSSDFDADDSEILTNVLELQNIRVKESMVPRTEIVALEKTATIRQATDTFISSGFSKLPVYEESIDNIIGVVFAYDLFRQPENLSDIIRPVKHVPGSQRAKALLAEFRQQNISLSIVIDEYGGTAGLVTIEDLLEEVVGDIQDEYDEDDEFIKKLADNTWLISGNVEIDNLNDSHPEIAIDETDDYETVAGYIIHMEGRIPKLNEEIIIGKHRFIITKATQTRIEVVKMQFVENPD
ncbi:MAG: HlyC/CorC family transporter [Bacteroidetes bacterium]|nr:HlyC/CorC family transporter [Bacteroidota bacterium]MCH8523071.1 hemolysin family protein [Balneolales bacterium]